MEHYIDADRLKELLDAKYKEFTEKEKKDYCHLQYQYMADGLDVAEQFIDSLQQEQPEVDLEKEIEEYFGEDWKDGTPIEVQDDMIKFARHFYNLGLNARKEY